MESAVRVGVPGTHHEAFLRALPIPALVCRVERDASGAVADLVVVEANDAITAVAGTVPTAWPGSRVGDLLGRAFLDPYLPLIEELLKTGAATGLEVVPTPDGRWYRTSVYPVGVDLVAVVAIDITDRRAAVAALQEREALHQAAFDALHDGVLVQDASGRIIAASASASRILGVPADELVGLDSLASRWQGRDATGAPLSGDRFAGQTVLRTGQPVRDLLIDVARPDGSRVLLLHNAEPLHDASGAVRGAVVSFEDVTERQEAQRTLDARTSELERALADLEEARDITGLAVWRRDLVTGEGWWSPRMFALFGGDPAGPPPPPAVADAMLDADTLRRRGQAIDEGARTGRPWELETEVRPPEADARWILWHGVTEVDDAGRAVAAHGTALDITMRKRAELVLREFAGELERRVAERTAELEAANEELRSFTYSVSHDLRAPVRAIAGFARLLELRNGEQLDEAGRHRLDNIVTAGEAMGHIIDDLLAYSRVGRAAVRREPVDLDAVVDRVLTTCAATLDATGGRVEIRRPLPCPVGDPTLAELVLLNLVQNALVHRRDTAEPLVVVSADADAGGVVIAVADNGMGIAADALERIFEPFYRADTVESHPGTGIGLAIVRRCVVAMGGTVTVTSEPGAGSTFSVTLPAA